MAGLASKLALLTLMSPTSARGAQPSNRNLLTPQQVKAEIIKKCGLPASGVSVDYQRDMQEDVVWIGKRISRSSSTLTCLTEASIRTTYYIYFRDSEVQKLYDTRYSKLSHQFEVRDARNRLATRNLLSALPQPEKGQPLARYAEAVESFCGVRRDALLEARDEHTLTYTKNGLGQLTPRGVENPAANEDQFKCVMTATSAADLERQGIFFGFVGRAAAPTH